jgi:hypothetical protein
MRKTGKGQSKSKSKSKRARRQMKEPAPLFEKRFTDSVFDDKEVVDAQR